MRPVSKLSKLELVPLRPNFSNPQLFSHYPGPRSILSSACTQCQHRGHASILTPSTAHARHTRLHSLRNVKRHYSSSPKPPPSSSRNNGSINASTDPQQDTPPNLPSHIASRRSPALKRLQPYMDHFLARLAVASHALNTYTGTDFSAISQLRAQITALEGQVASLHAAVASAKAAHDSALAAQAAAQKEVVALLERKHAWAPEDLERYMALIRSEHEQERAVADAKDGLQGAERGLEDARARLEGCERRQYHEEQVWSDTIRRNSTWVTFGLMGVNVVLLLASLVVIEPWRRRRLVREIKLVLAEEKGAAAEAMKITESGAQPPAAALDEVQGASEADILSILPAAPEPKEEDQQEPQPLLKVPLPPSLESGGWTWAACMAYWHDLFSDRQVVLSKVDVTKAALEGGAAGAAAMGLLFVLLRPR